MESTECIRAITSKYLFDGEQMLTDKIVLVKDGLIHDLVDKNTYTGSNVEDFGDQLITTGLIDLQLNGSRGGLFNKSISIETLEEMY